MENKKTKIVDSIQNVKTRIEKEPMYSYVVEHKNRLKDKVLNRNFFLGFVLFLILVGLIVGPNLSNGLSVSFYPKTCLGGWEHPSHASGQPDVSADDQDKTSKFNDDNSSVLTNQISDMFCGEFAGDVLEGTVPQKITLHFSMAVSDSLIENQVNKTPSSTDTDPIILTPDTNTTTETPETPETTETPVDSLAPVQEVIHEAQDQTNTQTDPTPGTSSVDPIPNPAETTQSPIEAPSEDPVPVSTPPSQDQSLISKVKLYAQSVYSKNSFVSRFISRTKGSVATNIALAQETDPAVSPITEYVTPVETVTETPIDTPPEVVAEPIAETPPETTVEPTTETTQISEPVAEPIVEPAVDPEPIPVPENNIVKVAYSIKDGVWHDLGNITLENWKDLSFDINDPDVSEWQDISKLQIKLTSISSFDTHPVVYLDGMYIKVDYDKLEDLENPPTILLKDKSINIVSGDDSFIANDEPVFTITDPNLTTKQINELVDQNKADILQDDNQVLNKTAEEIAKNPDFIPPKDTSADTLTPPDVTPTSLDKIKDFFDPLVEKLKTNTEDTTQAIEKVSSVFSVNRADAATGKTNKVMSTEIYFDGGLTDKVTASVENVVINGIPKQQIKIDKPKHEFKPGKYTIKIKLKTAQAILVSSQDFTWGVLSINTDKTVYNMGEVSYLQMGVLNERGHTICNADLDMKITSPSGVVSNFTTGDGSIVREGLCGEDNVIDVPDYYAHFTIPQELGSYNILLTATTANGVKSITDKIDVEDNIMFDVSRYGPSRIYPLPSYPMAITVNSPTDWSGTVTETVPVSFDITQPQNSQNYDSVFTDVSGDFKTITWSVNLTAGQDLKLGYYFNAPDISPEFFLLGPLVFKNSLGLDVWQEHRQWQIASDGVNRYWVGGTGNWDQTTTTHWAASSNGAGGASVPTAVDNVFFDGSSGGGTVTLATATALAFDLDFTGYTGTWAASAIAITISGKLTLGAGMTNSYIGTMTFNATSGTQVITSNGKALGTLTFNGVGGTWQLADALNISTRVITLTNGTLNTNGQTVTAGSISSSNSNARTLTLGASSITLSGATPVTFSITGGLFTFNTGTSNITLTGPSLTFNGAGFTYYDVTITSAATGTLTITGENTYRNFSYTGAASLLSLLSVTSNQTITGTLTITSNSSINRIFVRSSTLGSPVTINAAAVSLSNVDFMDISTAGAASPFTGTTLGDCVGNSGFSGVTPVTRYAKTGTSKNWSDTTLWSTSSGGSTGASVPLCQDTAIFDASSITAGAVTITLNISNIGTVNFTGVTNSPTYTAASAHLVFGSLTLVSGITHTPTGSTAFYGRSSPTFTSAGKSMFKILILVFNSTLTLQDSLTASSSITLSNGTLDTNGQNITSDTFVSAGSTSRTLTLGATTWTVSGTGTVWNMAATALTLNSGTSTIKITNTSATARTFAGAGLSYYNFWSAAGASTASLTISGSNFFNDFQDTGTAAHSILFTVGTTTTVNTFTVSGTAGNLKTINSTTTGVHYLNKVGGGTVSSGFLNIQHSIASPATTWYAGTTSTNNQAVATAGSGWVFTAPPGGGCTGTSTGTWGGTDTANFTGCTGAASGGTGTGARPGAGDAVTINSGITVTLGANTAVLGALTLNGSLTTSGTNYSLSATNININSTGTLTANASTITLSGTGGVVFYKDSAGTFTYGTSTVIMNGNITVLTLTGGNATQFYNLTLSPTITAASVYTFGNGLVTVNNTFTVNPTAASALALTVNLGVNGMTVVGSTSVTRTTSATSTLTTTASNYPITMRDITIATGGTFTSNASNVTITGTSGTLITNTGTWTNPTSPGTTTLSGNGSATISTGALSFWNLTSSGTGTKTTAAALTTTVANVLTISAGTFASGTTATLTLSGSIGTPFINSSVFDCSTGTVSYTGNYASGDTKIVNTTYYKLTLNNSSEIFDLVGTITVNVAGTLTLTNGILDTTTNNYSISAGKISIASAVTAILKANASTITLTATSGTLFTRGASGVFTQGTSEVIVAPGSGSGITLLSAATTFHRLTINSSAAVINAGAVITMSSADAANRLYVQNGVLNDGGNTIVGTANGTLVVDSGDGLCISGTAAGTTATCDSGATPVAASTFPTNYTNGNITLNAGSNVYYLPNAGTSGSPTIISSTPSYGNLILSPVIATSAKFYQFSGATTINGNFTIWPTSGAFLLTVNMAGDITMPATKTLTIRRTTSTALLDTRPVSTDYNISTGFLDVQAGATLDCTSSSSTITLTGISGTLFQKAGTFTQGTSEVIVAPASGTGITLLSAGTTFHRLTINSSAAVINAGAVITMSNADAANRLYVQNGVLNDGGNTIVGTANGTLVVDTGESLCISGTAAGTTATCDSGATPVAASTFPTNYTNGNITLASGSNVYYNGNVAMTISATPTYGNLRFYPVLTANRAYTLGTTVSVTGTLDSDPSAASTFTLTTNVGSGGLTVGSTLLLQGSGSGVSTLDTGSGLNYTLTVQSLNIVTGSTLNIRGSDFYVTGTSGVLLTRSGTFTANSASATRFIGNGNVTLTDNSTWTFGALRLEPTITSTDKTYTFGSGAITTNGNFVVDPTAASALTLNVVMANDITVGSTKTTIVQRTTSALSSLDTAGFGLSTGLMNINTGATLLANASTITLSGAGNIFTKAGTFTAGTSAIKVTDTSSSLKTFSGNGGTYNNFWYAPGAGTGILEILGSNTFLDFRDNGSIAHTLLFTAGTTQTVTTFTVSGNSGQLITIDSGNGSGVASTSTHALVKSGGGSISSNYLNIQHSVATPSTLTWYAGTTSTDNQSVATAGSGWIFAAAPCISVATGNWNTGGSWSGCSGAGGIPGTGDNVIISSGDTITQDINTPVLGTLTIDGTLDTSGTNYSISATNLTISTTGTLTANASTITLSGTSGTLFTRTGSGVFTYGTSTVVMNPNASITVSSGMTGVYNLTFSPTLSSTGKTYTTTENLTIYGDFNINPNAGSSLALTVSLGGVLATDYSKDTMITKTGSATTTFDTNGYQVNTGILSVLTGATFNAGSSLISVNKANGVNPSLVVTGTFNSQTSTVSYTDISNILVNYSITYYNLTMASGSPAYTTAGVNVSNNLTLENQAGLGNFTSTAGRLIGNGSYHDILGTLTLNASSGTLITDTSTSSLNIGGSIKIQSDASVTINTPTYNANLGNIEFSPTLTNNRTYTLDYITFEGAIDVKPTAASAYTLTIMNDGGFLGNSNPFYATSILNLDPQSSALVVFDTSNDSAISVDRITADSNSTLYGRASTITLKARDNTSLWNVVNFTPNTSVVVVDTSDSDAVFYGSGTSTFYGLTFSPSYITTTRTLNTGGALTVNGDFTINPDDQTAGGTLFNVVMDGNITNATTKTFTIDSTGAESTVLDTAGYSISTGNMVIASGNTLTANASAITVADDWTNDGTFTTGTSTVTLNSAATAIVSGTTTFYNLTITHTAAKEVNFSVSGSPIFHVTNDFVVTGHAGDLIKLYSTTPATQWNFHPTGTATVDYADVKDGGCEVGSITIYTTASTDSGNNDSCWNFAKTITFSISDNSIGFGTLSTLNTRYATTTGGAGTETAAHTLTASTNAPGGYTIYVVGDTLKYLANSIPAIGGTNTAPSAGTAQFGIRATKSGTGVVDSKYSASGFAYDGTSVLPTTLATGTGDNTATDYSLRYVSNISDVTPAGNYSSTLTYLITGSF